jgi:hypothetical protein
MLAFSLAGKGKRIQTDVTSSGINFAAYAVMNDKGHTSITLINKDTTIGARVTVRSQSDFKSAQMMRLVAPSFDAKTDVTLAGAQVSSNGHWKPKDIEKLKPVRGQIAVDLSPASASLVFLT